VPVGIVETTLVPVAAISSRGLKPDSSMAAEIATSRSSPRVDAVDRIGPPPSKSAPLHNPPVPSATRLDGQLLELFL
jgi:hypothetical protein